MSKYVWDGMYYKNVEHGTMRQLCPYSDEIEYTVTVFSMEFLEENNGGSESDLMTHCMRKFRGRINPAVVNETVKKVLKTVKFN